MSLSERNRTQIEIKDRVMYQKMARAVENEISRNLVSWKDWDEQGYAVAFDDAWRMGMRDHNAIITYMMFVVGTRKIVNKLK